MSNKYIKNCLTCEFGFDNDNFDKDYNPFHPDRLIITCAGNTELYGKEVPHDFICNYWSVGLEEFSRIRNKVSYLDCYKSKLDLIKK